MTECRLPAADLVRGERLCSNSVSDNPKRNKMLPPPMKRSIASLVIVGAALLPVSLATSARGATMILHSFTGGASDGSYPFGSLTLSGLKLYGLTTGGGSSDGGTLFCVNTDGTGFGLLHNFTGAVGDGASPLGSLTLSGSKIWHWPGRQPWPGELKPDQR